MRDPYDAGEKRETVDTEGAIQGLQRQLTQLQSEVAAGNDAMNDILKKVLDLEEGEKLADRVALACVSKIMSHGALLSKLLSPEQVRDSAAYWLTHLKERAEAAVAEDEADVDYTVSMNVKTKDVDPVAK